MPPKNRKPKHRNTPKSKALREARKKLPKSTVNGVTMRSLVPRLPGESRYSSTRRALEHTKRLNSRYSKSQLMGAGGDAWYSGLMKIPGAVNELARIIPGYKHKYQQPRFPIKGLSKPVKAQPGALIRSPEINPFVLSKIKKMLDVKLSKDKHPSIKKMEQAIPHQMNIKSLIHSKDLRPRTDAPKLTSRPLAMPVAYGGTRRSAFMRQVSDGNDIIIHCCDRLDSLVLDASTYTKSDVNRSGYVMAKISIGPQVLGERLRRLSSVFETYTFEEAQLHFCPARPTDTAGSVFGWFDQDPTDDPEQGGQTLKVGATHPGAHGTHVWQETTWHMPRRLKGRFFVEPKGTTPADLRFQEQGDFIVAVDIPIEDAGFIDGSVFIVASLYVEYRVRLSKPSLNTPFAGTYDWWYVGSSPNTSSPTEIIQIDRTLARGISNSLGIFRYMMTNSGINDVSTYMIPHKLNNGTSYLKPFTAQNFANGNRIQPLVISPGFWSVNVYLTFVSTNTVDTYEHFDLCTYPVESYLTDSVVGQAPTALTTTLSTNYFPLHSATPTTNEYVSFYGPSSGVAVQMTTTAQRSISIGSTLTTDIPVVLDLAYYCSATTASVGIVSIVGCTVSINAPFVPDKEMQAAIDPTSFDTNLRVLEIEKKLDKYIKDHEFESKEEKLESKEERPPIMDRFLVVEESPTASSSSSSSSSSQPIKSSSNKGSVRGVSKS